MACDDFLGQMGGQVLGCASLLLQHGGVEALGALGALFPPQAQRGHIVGGDGGHAAHGVGVEVGKLCPTLLGHVLNFERQHAQGVEHGCHAVGQHA